MARPSQIVITRNRAGKHSVAHQEAFMSTSIDTPPSTPGWHGQTFLVGEEIYLRRLEKRDARYAMSWRDTRYPISPSVTETWITESLNNERTGIWVIVRKVDDRVVGSLTLRRRTMGPVLTAYADPLHGDMGTHWQAEAYRLVIPWMRDELQTPSIRLPIAADEPEAIAALEEVGCIPSVRFREKLRTNGQWVDQLFYQALHPRWMERLGNPAEQPIERAGTGVPRPIPPRGTFTGDPPKGAMAIGERVYLKAFDKEDAEELSRLNRLERETGFGHSRLLTTNGNKVESRLEPASFRMLNGVGFAVRRRSDDCTIGDCGLQGIDYVNRRAESYSWLYSPDARGEGLGFEAKQLLLAYAFDTLGLHSVQSFVQAANLRSAAALRKQGYREAGRLYWSGMADGTFTSEILFDILADDWRALPRSTTTTTSMTDEEMPS